MTTKTLHGSDIDVLEVGKTDSRCLFIKTNVRTMVDNADIVWPDNHMPGNAVDTALEKIKEVIDNPKKKTTKQTPRLNGKNKTNVPEVKVTTLTGKEKKESHCLNGEFLNSKRVSYLEKAYTTINSMLFNELCPDMVTISWSFPTTTPKKVLGQALNCLVDNEQNNFMIVINPTINNSREILLTLCHEMIHIKVGFECGHRKEFTQEAKAIGFERPYTKLKNVTSKFDNQIKKIIDKLGEIPNGHIELGDSKKKQPTRNRLYMCDCEVKIRSAGETLNATCDDCNSKFKLQ